VSVVLALTWILQLSGTTASLRGISAVSDTVVWASGTSGTFLRTLDGGAHWTAATVPGATDLDFRALHAFNRDTAILLSIGTGDKSRLYKTTDAGATWSLLYTNPDSQGFFDAIQFWDATHGILIGDPVQGYFTVMTTSDAGITWQRQKTPPAMPNEGAFAASGTCLVVGGKSEAWFGTGGPAGARVFHSVDQGVTWTVATTPIRNDVPAAGIFGLAFRDSMHGIAVGGNYAKPADSTQNIAITSDGGKTWTAPAGTPPSGFRSATAYMVDRKVWITTGTSGSDFSTDDGKNWQPFGGGFNALAGTFAAGPKGAIARLKFD